MTILYLPKFVRQYKKLPIHIQNLAEKKELLFRQNPFDPRLRTHKLQGDLAGYWSFSIDYSYRIIFQFAENDAVWFYSIGDHDIYDQ